MNLFLTVSASQQLTGIIEKVNAMYCSYRSTIWSLWNLQSLALAVPYLDLPIL